MTVKKRHPLRNSKIKKIIEELKPRLGKDFEKLSEGEIETAELDSGEQIIIAENQPLLVKREDGEFFPLISSAQHFSLRKVVVDMGAVKHIADGADVMAPGIVKADEEIEKEEIVAIEDEKNQKIIGIGTALKEGSSLKGEEGKVVKTLHYVGDRLWTLSEEL